MKIHAKDYLVELACSKDIPTWLSYIIYGVLKNGDLSENALEEFLSWLEKNPNRGFDHTVIESLSNEYASNKTLKLKKLTHHSGVNALVRDSEIKFCNDITILYGYNGSGKSGYFRILNEISGGGVPHPILPNVYEKAAPISVSLEYEVNGVVKNLEWAGVRGNGRDEVELRVFDSRYATNLISRRTIDVAAVEPLGLHLFGLVSEKVDAFKKIVLKRIEELGRQFQPIDDRNLPEDLRGLVESRKLTRREYEMRVAPIEFTPEECKRLAVVQSQIANLQQRDAQPTIKYKEILLKTLSSVEEEIKQQGMQFEMAVVEWNGALSQYADVYHAAKRAKEQYSVLSGIPGSDSDLWRQFIQKGVEYSSLHENEYAEHCPYCHQLLRNDPHAIGLVKGYVAFLNDKTQKQCAAEWARLQNLQKRIKALSVDCVSVHTLSQVIADQDKGEFSDLLERIENYAGSLRRTKQQFDVDVEQLRATEVVVCRDDLVQVESLLSTRMGRCGDELAALREGFSVRQVEINKLKDEQFLLLQRQEVSRLKSQLDKLSTQIDILEKWKTFHASISSRRISDLSRIAHNDLLTEKLQTKFSSWFCQFGFKSLNVSLVVASASKGIPQTELRITGVDKAIPTVLSEGEQKAAALAMFLTEAEMQLVDVPLVFDDPVNSLDHRLITAFANMLMGMDQQIIVFTHNRMFVDVFRASNNKIGHLCKNFTGGCSSGAGKHIYLWKIAAANGRTGWISQGRGDSAKDLLNIVHTKLGNPLLEDELLVVSAFLRKAVEKLIDEVLLKNIEPCRFHIPGSHIEWEKLRELNQEDTYQRKWMVLNKAFGGLSNKELHEGEMSRESPITQDELVDIYGELAGLCAT